MLRTKAQSDPTGFDARLIEAIVQAGHIPATTDGIQLSFEDFPYRYREGVSLISKEQREVQTRRFGLPKRASSRRIIATIWTDDLYRKATKKHWVVEVHGQDKLEFVKPLIDSLEKSLRVSARVKVMSESLQVPTSYGATYWSLFVDTLKALSGRGW